MQYQDHARSIQYDINTINSDKQNQKPELHPEMSPFQNYIEVCLHGHQIYALVDTGAGLSCISPELYQELQLEEAYVLDTNFKAQNVHGIGGNRIVVKGKMIVPISVGRVTIEHEIVLLGGMAIDLILGMDFILACQASLDFTANTFYMFNKQFSVPLRRNTSAEVRIKTIVTIPPRSETVVPLHVPFVNTAPSMILEPRASFNDIWQVIPARVVATVTNSTFMGRMLNPTNIPITLTPGTVVGFLDEVETIVNSPKHTGVGPLIGSVIEKGKGRTDKVAELVHTLGLSLDKADITHDEKQELATFLLQNVSMFATSTKELGNCTLQQLTIDTNDAPPVRQRPYRVSPLLKKEIDTQVQDMLDNGIIRESNSCYSSPVVMVKKANGDFRFAIDYRKLNSQTVTMNYPLPQFGDVLDILGSAKLFSVVDLKSGFWQINVDEVSKHKTAFICHSGLYEFNRMPFGLKNAPIIFQSVIESALRGLNHNIALVYVDDIIIFSEDFQSHLNHLQRIFQHLEAANLKLHPSKCNFCVEQVKYLGHIVSKGGVTPDPGKITAVTEFPTPKRQKDVRSFLGLTNYYRKFVKDYAKIADPLNQLLKKDEPFNWTDQCQNAFDVLKTALTTAPILAYPNFHKQFILSTDASNTAISFILSQLDNENRERVIYYGGRGLRPRERLYGITEKETLAVLVGIRAYRVYLANTKFVVRTDHSAIKYLTNTKDPTGRLGRWAIALQAYDFEVLHTPGNQHSNADGLSRRDYPKEEDDEEEDDLTPVFMISDIQSDIPDEDDSQSYVSQVEPYQAWSSERDILISTLEPVTVEKLQKKDIQLKPMIQYLKDGVLPEDFKEARKLVVESHDYVLIDTILYHLWYPKKSGTAQERVVRQLVVPHSLRNDILLSMHDTILFAAHAGIDRTYHNIRLRYYWPGMYHDIVQYVKSCVDCQASKRSYIKNKPPLCPLPQPELFQRWHMDFLGPLEKSVEGNQYVLILVDAYSHWVEGFPMKTMEAQEVAKILFREVITRYGTPKTLLTDRAPNFIGKIMQSLCSLFQITKLNTSAYHPQTNSTVERFNSYLGATLRAMCGDTNTHKWDTYLYGALSAFRITPSTQSTQFSPYFLLFKRECRLPIEIALTPPQNLGVSAAECIHDIVDTFNETQKLVKENVQKARDKYTKQYNKNAQTHTFVVGQQVMCYFPRSAGPGRSAKLTRKWLGPFYICACLKNNTFILRRSSDNAPLKGPVHAIRLKPFFDPSDRPTNPLPDELFEELDIEEEDLMILQETDNDPSQLNVNTTDTPGLVSEQSETPTTGHSSHTTRPSEDNVTERRDIFQKELPYPEYLNTDNASPSTDPPPAQDTNTLYEVEKILASKLQNGSRLYKIKWKGYRETTWEPANFIPDQLKRDFHIRKTNEGRARKKKRTHNN